MNIPASDHFTPIPLDSVFNINRQSLPDGLQIPAELSQSYGLQTHRGIPFRLGEQDRPNVLLLSADMHQDDEELASISIEVDSIHATYLLFLHVVQDRTTNYLDGLADNAIDGNELGDQVSDYSLEYVDGTSVVTPILRRFAIQQSHIGWGASPFAAVPHAQPEVFNTTTEALSIGRMPIQDYGRGETRHRSGRDSITEKLWLYALPNPHPDKPIQRILCTPRSERSAIYAISATTLTDHPLRPGVRRKARLTLPPGARLNGLGELDGVQIDMGNIISARAELEYDEDAWFGDATVVQPQQSKNSIILEYAAHPAAKLYVETGETSFAEYDLAQLDEFTGLIEIEPALRPVKLRIVEKDTNRLAPVRLHLHGAAGEYLPPRGHHRKVNPYWFEDNYGEFVNGHNQYSYVNGECVTDLPLGTVYVEITRGYEVAPIRTSFEVTPETAEITFELDKVLHWREAGWVTADTHVHFLSPQTALLEGQAEGVHVVNLLASQWGEMFSNVTDFDGMTTIGAKDFGGDGEFLVRVGTENRMQVLGHISLLGYSGSMIHPLCTGGPSESAIGDPQEVTMAEWAQRCIDQNGLVVLPHGPNPQLERAADIVLGVVNAIEMMTFNPLNPVNMQVSAYGIADWYRFLNLGYHVPVVGGSDKMAASSLLGGIRTYAHMGDLPFAYDNWMKAVRAGNTFVTVGPLVSMMVDGVQPGGTIELPGPGSTVHVTWTAESVSVPIEQVEIVMGGLVVEQANVGGELSVSGSADVVVNDSTWLAVRVRGSNLGNPNDIAAHTSAVQVIVDGKALFSEPDSMAVLEQIEGAMAYVDTLAPRPDVQRFKQLRATLEAAYNRLHQQMHNAGIFHRHTPLHSHDEVHEH